MPLVQMLVHLECVDIMIECGSNGLVEWWEVLTRNINDRSVYFLDRADLFAGQSGVGLWCDLEWLSRRLFFCKSLRASEKGPETDLRTEEELPSFVQGGQTRIGRYAHMTDGICYGIHSHPQRVSRVCVNSKQPST